VQDGGGDAGDRRGDGRGGRLRAGRRRSAGCGCGCEVSLTTIRTTTTRTTAATAEPAIIRRRRRACARRCAARICAALCWDSRLFFDTPVTLHHPPVPSQLGPAIATSQRDRSESIAGDRSRAAL